jgi:putative phosphoribosyl transferase
VTSTLGISSAAYEEVLAVEAAELERREQLFRGGRPPLDVRGKMAILVDDGLATGATMRAAVESVRRRGPSGIVLAVPVASADTCEIFRPLVDTIICLLQPIDMRAVGIWYADFTQTTDSEVRSLLEASARARPAESQLAAPTAAPTS